MCLITFMVGALGVYNIPVHFHRLRKVKMKEAVDGGTHATLDGTSHQHKHKVCSMHLLQVKKNV
jgi:hypothetical protein